MKRYNRSLKRRRAQKKILNETKRNIANHILLESYNKGTNTQIIFDIASEKDLRNIIDLVQNNMPAIRAIDNCIREAIISGQFTNSKSKVANILREHKVTNEKGLLKESWMEFGIDMFFGFGPMIADAIPGVGTVAGRGIAIGGMLYYGSKLSQAIQENNTFDQFIHGMSLVFSLIAAFPAVGSAIAGYGRSLMGIFSAIATPIWRIFSGGARLIFGGPVAVVLKGSQAVAGATLKSALKNAGFTDEAFKLFSEAGEQLLKNGGNLEKLSEFAGKGAKYIDELEKLAPALKEALEKIPLAGKKVSGMVDDLIKLLTTTGDDIAEGAAKMSKAAEVSTKLGLESTEAGVLTMLSTATTPAEIKAANEALEVMLKANPEIAQAVKQLGFIDEAFEITLVAHDEALALGKFAQGAKSGAKGDVIRQSVKAGQEGLKQSAKEMIDDAARGLGAQYSKSTVRNVAKNMDEMATVLSAGTKATVATEKQITKASVSIYKGLIQSLDDVSRVCGTSIGKALEGIGKNAKTFTAAAGDKLAGKMLTDIVVEGGEVMVKVVGKEGAEETLKMTTKATLELVENGVIQACGNEMKKGLAKKGAEITTRAVTRSGAEQALEEGGELLVRAGVEATEEVTGEALKIGAGMADDMISLRGVEDQVAGAIGEMPAIVNILGRLLDPGTWFDFSKTTWFDVISSTFRSVIDPAVTSQKGAQGINESIKLLERTERNKKRMKKYTSLKLLY